MEMKRIIEEELLAWKDDTRRKPLLLHGARQVGKTYSVMEFGRKHFDETVVADLERNRSLHRIFEGDLDARRILEGIGIALDCTIVPGRSLLFLDEIQACARAVVALRYLHEEVPGLHVVAAGSLLEFALGEIPFPVGRIRMERMLPLTFVEFLWAVGRDRLAGIALSPPGEVPEPGHRLLLEELRKYFFVGGMPESVKAWVETGSMRECGRVQRDLCESFREDFAKYAPRSDPRCLDSVFVGVARNVGRRIKYTRLAEGFSPPTIKKAFGLLEKAQVVTLVPAASPAGLPSGASASTGRFKALMLDIGLMQHLKALPVDAEFARGDLLAIHEGAMAEQFVGQEMRATQPSGLFYWSREARGSSAEVDYLASVDGKVVPVEVKGGASGRLRSMHMLLGSHPCPYGIVLSAAPYSGSPDGRLRFVPLYHAYSSTMSRATT